MALEFSAPARMEDLSQMQQGMQSACQALGLEDLAAEPVLAAGVAAWSALVLAGAQGLHVSLGRLGAGLHLTLAFDPPGPGPWPGLAPALFCPPAKTAELGWRGPRAVFSLRWED